MKIKKLTVKQYITYLAIIVFGILLDQGTKLLALRFLEPIGTFPIIRDALHLTYCENPGAAFGMLADNRAVFIVVSFVMLAVLIPYLFLGLTDSKLSAISVAMIIAGGIGNMIDRLSARGTVIDFVDFRLINFAIFNGADSFVCVGSALLVYALLKEINQEKKKDEQEKTLSSENTSDKGENTDENEDKSV